MANYDEVQRACLRTGVKLGSSLEKDARREIWNIAGRDFSEPSRSEKIDKFLQASKENPEYADSLIDAPKAPEEKELDLHGLTVDQHTHIAQHGLGPKKKPEVTVPEKATDVIVFSSEEELLEAGRKGLK